jgi:hypothetical protein
LESTNGGRLETQVSLEILSNFTDEALEGKFAEDISEAKFRRSNGWTGLINLYSSGIDESHGVRQSQVYSGEASVEALELKLSEVASYMTLTPPVVGAAFLLA